MTTDTGAPGLRTVPGEGAWLSTVCGALKVVVVTEWETDGVATAGTAGFVVVVVLTEVDDVVPGGLVVDERAGTVVVVGGRTVVVVVVVGADE